MRIVVFHDVPDRIWFESMIRTLTESFYVISPEMFQAHTFDTARINILITFDDGYASWETVALPVLSKYNLKALFFINSGLIDSARDRAKVTSFMREQLHITPREALSWEGVKKLHVAGHTIGGHARTHKNLASIDGEEVEQEIRTDKVRIEEQLGVKITDFAYPFGTEKHVNETARAVARAVGYTHAYTAISRFVTKKETFSIPRMCIETDLTPSALKRWISGAYDLFDMIKRLFV